MKRLALVGLSMLAAALAAFPHAASATSDLAVPAVVCVPGNTQTMNAENKPLTAGVVRQMGRNTPPRSYYCPIFNPDLTAAQPSWHTLRLTYADNTAAKGNITLRLFAKSRAKVVTDPPLGTTFVVAQVASQAGVGVREVSAPFSAALDFDRYSYWFVLDLAALTGTVGAQVDAHELQLTD
ncbi:MAG: hypothetical protein JSR59_14200 [Proteobacteria bacterium]|nr:hypothetical protein [Pseudomonadota bacterium]